MNFSHMNAKQVHPLRFYFGLLIVILSRKEEYKQELSLKQTILLPSLLLFHPLKPGGGGAGGRQIGGRRGGGGREGRGVASSTSTLK